MAEFSGEFGSAFDDGVIGSPLGDAGLFIRAVLADESAVLFFELAVWQLDGGFAAQAHFL